MVVSHVIGHRSPRLLRQYETLYMDGTFRSCPARFEQLFTIMGHYHGRPVPLVNCLMEARTIGHYRHVPISEASRTSSNWASVATGNCQL